VIILNSVILEEDGKFLIWLFMLGLNPLKYSITSLLKLNYQISLFENYFIIK